jgi:hypothetical protein
MGTLGNFFGWLGEHLVVTLFAVLGTLLLLWAAVLRSWLLLRQGRSITILNRTLTPGVWRLALPLPLSRQQLQSIQTRDPRELHSWLIKNCGALDFEQTELRLDLQGRSTIPAVITNIRVKVVARAEPATGALVKSPSAGAVSSVALGFDLTEDALATAVQVVIDGPTTWSSEPYFRAGAISLNKDEPFVVVILARVSDGTVSWRLVFDIAVRRRTRSVTFPPEDRPAFVTTAAQREDFGQLWLAGVASLDSPPYLRPATPEAM